MNTDPEIKMDEVIFVHMRDTLTDLSYPTYTMCLSEHVHADRTRE